MLSNNVYFTQCYTLGLFVCFSLSLIMCILHIVLHIYAPVPAAGSNNVYFTYCSTPNAMDGYLMRSMSNNVYFT